MALFHGLHGDILGTQKQSPSSSSWVRSGWGDTRLSRALLLPSRAWLCYILLGSLSAYFRAHSAPTPAVQKSAQSVPSDASGLQVQHTKTTSSSPLDTALDMTWAGVLLRRWGWLLLVVMETLGNASGRGKDQPGVASLSCSCCLYTSAPELDRARDLRKNFSATWWIWDWCFLSLVYEKKLRKPI